MPFPNVMDLFGGRRQEQQQPPVQQQQQQQQRPPTVIDGTAATMQAKGGDGATVPGAGTGTGQEQKPPLDEFSELWKDEPATQANAAQGKPKGYLGMDPAKFAEHAAKMDFSRSIDPALASKALSGDAASFSQVLNQVAQSALAASFKASHAMVERGLTAADAKVWERFPSEVKKHSLFDTAPSQKNFQHPSVAPVYKMIQSQMASKFPDATTSELNAMTERYFNGMVAGLDEKDATGTGKSPNGKAPEETDWSEMFGV